MSLYSKIQKLVDQKFPGKKVKQVYSFSDKAYMCLITEVEGKDFNAPYYLVDKNATRIYPFSPMMDIDKFNEAINKPVSKE